MCSFGPCTWLGTQPTAINETTQSPAVMELTVLRCRQTLRMEFGNWLVDCNSCRTC